jgi:hypothetical protein
MLPYDVVGHGMIGFACQLLNPPLYWISGMLCLEKLYAGIKSKSLCYTACCVIIYGAATTTAW